jgi:peptide deformylase
MAQAKNNCNHGTLQKWLPLTIVNLDSIPQSIDLDLVNKIKVYDLVFLGSLMESLCVEKNGVGLSAFQVGIPLPFFVASKDGKKFAYYYECDYEGRGELIDSIEGCLSILDGEGLPRRFLIKRFKNVKCKGKRINFQGDVCFEEFSETFDDMLSIVLQHEIDHQKPVLISEIGKEISII